MSVEIAANAVFRRMNDDSELRSAVGDDDGVIRASPDWPDLTTPQADTLPRLVYRLPVVVPNGGLFQASGSLHLYVPPGAVGVARTIEQALIRLFNGGGSGTGWEDIGYRFWCIFTGGGEDPRVEDDEPIHWFREIELDGSLT